ncbi:MAG TPA: hypothetical protein VLA12_08190, partial [Planctomycetaceae bacterium]|nr:hypothetical protein [Planctomycetaceae bacterium]
REAALRMAQDVLSRSDLTDAERFDAIYVAAYGRSIREDEIERNLQFLGEFSQDASIESDKARLQSWQLLCQAVLASNEFMYLK